MLTGTVKWFNCKKGYGFIEPETSSKDVFVHITQLEKKMNNIYCWYVIDKLYQCYKLNIRGNKVEEIIKMVGNDVSYLEKHQVNPELLSQFRIIKEGLDTYGKYREEKGIESR